MGNSESEEKKEEGLGAYYDEDIPHLKAGQTIIAKAYTVDKTKVKISLENLDDLGFGAFGMVNKMLVTDLDRPDDGVKCAVKIPGPEGFLAKIELYLLLKLQHDNVVKLMYYFIPKGLTDNIVIVLELIEGGDLFRYMKNLPTYDEDPSGSLGILFEAFCYQMFRGLAFCHSHNILHRDIKPENLLVNPVSGELKIADYGCGAELKSPTERHTWYIGTRLFRPPELLLGAELYDAKVDVWSAAVVVTEMVIGAPIFYARGDLEVFLEAMFEHIGVPTDEDLKDMKVHDVKNMPTHVEKLTSIEERVQQFKPKNEEKIIAFLKAMLVFSPKKRISAWEACASDLFDPLYKPIILESGKAAPKFFNFSPQELQSMPADVKNKLTQGT